MKKNDRIRIPKQKRSKALTEHIVKTAMELFSERGYYSVTSHDIADAAKISIGSFYSYFSDKKQLLLAVLGQYIEQVNQTLPDMENALALNEALDSETLKKWIMRVLNAHRINSGFDRQITILTLDDPDVADIIAKQEAMQVDLIEHLLQSCLQKEEHSDSEIKAAAYVINNAIEKNVHALAYSKSLIDENSVLDALSEMISRYIHGLDS